MPYKAAAYLDVKAGRAVDVAAGITTACGAWCLYNYAQTAYSAKVVYIDVVRI